MYSTNNLLAMGVCALLSVAIPVAAVIFFKLKNKDSWLPSAFIGAGTFLVFAMILEQLLHSVMLPLVNNSTVLYAVYGALAAGIFEETGRFVAYKTLIRKHCSTKNAVLTGLGHGGFEAVLVLGVAMINYIFLAISVNSIGMEAVLEQMTAQNPETAEAVRTQLTALTDYGFLNCALTVYERVIAMAFHVCMSVWVCTAVSEKGKLWLYPAAVAVHAALDFPMAFVQKGALSIPVCYIILTVFSGIIITITVKMSRKKSAEKE